MMTGSLAMPQYQVKMFAIPVVPEGSNMGISILPNRCNTSHQRLVQKAIDFFLLHRHPRRPSETHGPGRRAAVFISFVIRNREPRITRRGVWTTNSKRVGKDLGYPGRTRSTV